MAIAVFDYVQSNVHMNTGLIAIKCAHMIGRKGVIDAKKQKTACSFSARYMLAFQLRMDLELTCIRRSWSPQLQ